MADLKTYSHITCPEIEVSDTLEQGDHIRFATVSDHIDSSDVLRIVKNRSEVEQEIMRFWDKIDICEIRKSRENYNGKFGFTDGPPFVSGNPHFGHVGVSYTKIIISLAKMFMGYDIEYSIGWDCHGFNVEQIINKTLGIVTASDEQKVSLKDYIKTGLEYIHSCSNSWIPVFKRLGRFVNFEDRYMTIDKEYMESVWYIFWKMHELGYIYEGWKIVSYSYELHSSLSNFEANLEYKDITSRTLYVKFPLKNDPTINFVAWTTTPWTLPMNLALCVNPDIIYHICVADNDEKYILCETGIRELEKKIKFTEIKKYCTGSELVGLEYIPLFNLMGIEYYKILADKYVTETTGTGIVHIAPGFGADDFRVCLKNNVIAMEDAYITCPINENCMFNENMGEFSGNLCLDIVRNVIEKLKLDGRILLEKSINHSYPHCYRTHKPLVYRLLPSWFVNVEKIRPRLVELNKEINWKPDFIGSSNMNSWLTKSDSPDWDLGRNRMFGTPIPIWKADDGSYICIGSIEELKKYSGMEDICDLHPDVVNEIIFEYEGKTYRRIKQIFDCWFESGCVPYASQHYPFENKEFVDKNEIEFIVEGRDQTRGWFYVMMVIVGIISDRPMSKNVLSTGMILDQHGKKFSKSSGNYVDPMELIEKYGSDITSLYIAMSEFTNAEDFSLSENIILLTAKNIIPYSHAVNFLNEYVQLYRIHCPEHLELTYYSDPVIDDYSSLDISDKCILQQTYDLRISVQTLLNEYDIQHSSMKIISYIDILTNWYIRFNRERMNGNDSEISQYTSLSVLMTVLFDFTLIMMPFAPFMTEYHYQNLKQFMPAKYDKITIQLLNFPDKVYDFNVENSFEKLKKIVEQTRFMRQQQLGKTQHTENKVPIKKMTIYLPKENEDDLEKIQELINIANDDINCQEYSYDTGEHLQYSVTINNSSIGKKFRKDRNKICEYIASLTQHELENIYCHEEKNIPVDEINVLEYGVDFVINTSPDIKPENDSEVVRIIDNIAIKYDVTYDEQIHYAREIRVFFASIQKLRGEVYLHPWNDVYIYVKLNEKYETYIRHAYELFSRKKNFIVFDNEKSFDEMVLDKQYKHGSIIFNMFDGSKEELLFTLIY